MSGLEVVWGGREGDGWIDGWVDGTGWMALDGWHWMDG